MTTLFDNQAVSVGTSAHTSDASSKKHGWLPVLVVLFLISYGLMTMLIVEQGQTIESQRTLIRDLFRDSQELSAAKMKTQQERNHSPSAKTLAPATGTASGHTPYGQAPSTQTQSTQTPSTQTPSTQAPNVSAPSSQAGPQHRAPNSATQKPQLRMPSKPASELVDDVRNLITI